MATTVNETVSQIVLPNGTTYDIEDTTARAISLEVTYTSATQNLALSLASAPDSDNEEF